VLGALPPATVQIWDNDPGVHFAIDQYLKILEGYAEIPDARCNRGKRWAVLPARSDYARPTSPPGLAQDYTATSGSLTFASGERFKLLTVPLLNDAVREATESFRRSR